MPTPRWRKRKAPKVGAPAGGAKAACICFASIHSSGHSVSDHLWGSIGENRYKELVSQATFFCFSSFLSFSNFADHIKKSFYVVTQLLIQYFIIQTKLSKGSTSS